MGGDERQHELGARVQARLDEEGLPIRVRHLRSGCSGNRAGVLDEAVKHVGRHDAVILLRYMRTGFGRSLRRGIDRPWVACPGVGVGQVTRKVREVGRFDPPGPKIETAEVSRLLTAVGTARLIPLCPRPGDPSIVHRSRWSCGPISNMV